MFVQPDEKAYTLNDARAMFEHRAPWLYYLAENPPTSETTAPLHKAIRKCGLYHAAAKFGKFKTIEVQRAVHRRARSQRVRDGDRRRPTRSSRSTSITARSSRPGRRSGPPMRTSPLCAISRWKGQGIIEGIGERSSSSQDHCKRRRRLSDSHLHTLASPRFITWLLHTAFLRASHVGTPFFSPASCVMRALFVYSLCLIANGAKRYALLL